MVYPFKLYTEYTSCVPACQAYFEYFCVCARVRVRACARARVTPHGGTLGLAVSPWDPAYWDLRATPESQAIPYKPYKPYGPTTRWGKFIRYFREGPYDYPVNGGEI